MARSFVAQRAPITARNLVRCSAFTVKLPRQAACQPLTWVNAGSRPGLRMFATQDNGDEPIELIELSIADLDALAPNHRPVNNVLSVPRPNKHRGNGKVQVLEFNQPIQTFSQDPAWSPVFQNGNARLARMENANVSAELDRVKEELVASQALIRTRDAEIAMLKSQLSERNGQLQQRDVQLAEARRELRIKEEELQALYERLISASRERSELRKLQLETEQELMRTRGELRRCMEGLTELASAINSLDMDGVDAPAFTFDDIEVQHEEVDPSWLEMLTDLSRLSKQALEDAGHDSQLVGEYMDRLKNN